MSLHDHLPFSYLTDLEAVLALSYDKVSAVLLHLQSQNTFDLQTLPNVSLGRGGLSIQTLRHFHVFSAFGMDLKNPILNILLEAQQGINTEAKFQSFAEKKLVLCGRQESDDLVQRFLRY